MHGIAVDAGRTRDLPCLLGERSSGTSVGMSTELERQLARLKHGDHNCSLPGGSAERVGIAAAFLKAGLAREALSLHRR